MTRQPKINRNVGLGLIKPLLEIQQGLEIVQNNKDLALIHQLRANLDAIPLNPDRLSTDWTLAQGSQVLDVVVGFISDIMDENRVAEDGSSYPEQHLVTGLLRDLKKLLDDAQEGILDKRLTKNPAKSRAFTALEIDRIQVLTETVKYMKVSKNIKKNKQHKIFTLKEAADEFAKRLKAHGLKFRGKEITGEQLVRWKDQPPGKRRMKKDSQ